MFIIKKICECIGVNKLKLNHSQRIIEIFYKNDEICRDVKM